MQELMKILMKIFLTRKPSKGVAPPRNTVFEFWYFSNFYEKDSHKYQFARGSQ